MSIYRCNTKWCGYDSVCFGKPVIATKVGGLPEMLENGELGILIPPKNEKAIKDTLIEIRNNTTLLDGYSNKIHKTYELGDKSWDNAVEILDRAIKSI